MPRKKFIDPQSRGEKIKSKMKEKLGKPIIVYGYYNSMSELKEALGIANVEIIKANQRNGTVRGLKVIKFDVAEALTKLVELKPYK